MDIHHDLRARWGAIWNRIENEESADARYYRQFVQAVETSKYLCIFGAGVGGGFCKNILEGEGFLADFYCDNDSNKWGQIINGIPCVSPDGLRDAAGVTTVVLATEHYASIHPEVSGMGISKIFRFDNHHLFAQREMLSDGTLKRNRTRLESVFGTLRDELSQLTYIKRLEALKGTAETIRKNRPVLAICAYHKIEDLWEIPEYILDLVPDYRLFFRHYTHEYNETVCYGVPAERIIN